MRLVEAVAHRPALPPHRRPRLSRIAAADSDWEEENGFGALATSRECPCAGVGVDEAGAFEIERAGRVGMQDGGAEVGVGGAEGSVEVGVLDRGAAAGTGEAGAFEEGVVGEKAEGGRCSPVPEQRQSGRRCLHMPHGGSGASLGRVKLSKSEVGRRRPPAEESLPSE